ncbi:MAG: PHP domain-containing protein [Tissierellia bacterium]|nr:PHP domain-containing protein [Tissierellia bacterium]MDD4780639.1 PHP domain-containing protein [Tissierellia bacterium]
MKYYYDLHIHSDLSPCGHKDMTPNNIVNMAYIKGLNIISVTDHNSTKNVKALQEVAANIGLEVIPGIEVTTREEVHVLCYFRNFSDAEAFGNIVYESIPNIKNNKQIFGEQNIYNSKDEIIGQIEKLLINASKYTLEEINKIVYKHNGIIVPAHINKKSNSILGILGFIPFDLEIDFIEIYQKAHIDEKLINKYKVLRNSDAHQLIDISESVNSIELNSIFEIYEYLKL